MSKRNNKLGDTDIEKLLGISNTTLRDWKKYTSDNWRKRLYVFLKSHTYSELELRVGMIKPFLDK